MNYFFITSLPEIVWEVAYSTPLKQFIDENESILEPLDESIKAILLYYEIQNIELLLREKVVEDIDNFNAIPFFLPSTLKREDIEPFFSSPSQKQPDIYPDFIVEYFENFREDKDRYNNIDHLYSEYFNYLKDFNIPFFKFYSITLSSIKTIISAFRMVKKGVDLDQNLVGEPEIVQTIVEHKTAADFGLRYIFPEINQLITIFDKDNLTLEIELDKFIYKILSSYKEEDPFGDHNIYIYIIGLLLKERWIDLDKEKGEMILDKIVNE